MDNPGFEKCSANMEKWEPSNGRVYNVSIYGSAPKLYYALSCGMRHLGIFDDKASAYDKARQDAFGAQPVREGQEGKALAEARRCLDRDQWCKTTTIDLTTVRTLVNALASQPDPAAEIAELRKDRDDLEAKWVEAVGYRARAHAAFERAESELAGLREALEPFGAIYRVFYAEEPDDKAISLGRWAEMIPNKPARFYADARFTVADFRKINAALANTADRGQEEKGK